MPNIEQQNQHRWVTAASAKAAAVWSAAKSVATKIVGFFGVLWDATKSIGRFVDRAVMQKQYGPVVAGTLAVAIAVVGVGFLVSPVFMVEVIAATGMEVLGNVAQYAMLTAMA